MDGGIVTEAEIRRNTGAEDGAMDTADLEAIMAAPKEAHDFASTGIDWLAPAFGKYVGTTAPEGYN